LEIKYDISEIRQNGKWEKFLACDNSQETTNVPVVINKSPCTASGVSSSTVNSNTDSVVSSNQETSGVGAGDAVGVTSAVDDAGTAVSGRHSPMLTNSDSNELSYDPAKWAKQHVVGSSVNLLLNSPFQPDSSYNFPKTSGQYSFQHSWFYQSMPDNSKRLRKWLSYSVTTDRVFCMDCMLFGGPTANDTWCRSGYFGWDSRHGPRDITNHECSETHAAAEIARMRWVSNIRIDKRFAQQRNTQIEQNRRVVYVEIKAIKYLAKEMMAYHGTSSGEGKFLNLFRLLAEFDQSAAVYLEKLNSIRTRQSRSKPEVNFLSPGNVRRLLSTMKKMVVEKIVEGLRSHGVCSLISDGTQDTSKLEAQCVILRYIEGNGPDAHPVERLIDIFTLGETTGNIICNRILITLKAAEVNLDTLVGQSYDGAGNMRGHISGLKTQMSQHAKKALYVWCHAHRLNLVVESLLACTCESAKAIGLIQELHTFFNGHKRHAVLVKMQSNDRYHRTLKRVSDTTRSWRSVEDGINTLLECFDSVRDSLAELERTATDITTVSSAAGLLQRIQEYDVIVCIYILRSFLAKTGPVSRLLQGVATDLAVVATLINGCIDHFRKCRLSVDHRWTEIMQEAKEFADKHNLSSNFIEKRQRRTPRMAGENVSDERIQTAEAHIKNNVFIVSLDTLLAAMEDRFTDQNLNMMKEMQLFAPAQLSKCIQPEDISELCDFYGFSAVEVVRERHDFVMVYEQLKDTVGLCSSDKPPSVSTPLIQDSIFISSTSIRDGGEESESVLRTNYDNSDDDGEDVMSMASTSSTTADNIHVQWLDQSFIKPLRVVLQLSSYPNLTCVYKTLTALAISSCSAERAMSRVRIVKNRLRSTMVDEFFSSLMVLASEKDLLDALPIDDITNRFASISLPLCKQLIYT